jgi:hypothetical protein
MSEQETVRLEHLSAELEGFATVADADHLHYEPVVMNFVDDPLVPGTHPVAAHTKPRSAFACSHGT